MSRELDTMSMYEWMLTANIGVEDIILESFVDLISFLSVSIRYLRAVAKGKILVELVSLTY